MYICATLPWPVDKTAKLNSKQKFLGPNQFQFWSKNLSSDIDVLFGEEIFLFDPPGPTDLGGH